MYKTAVCDVKFNNSFPYSSKANYVSFKNSYSKVPTEDKFVADDNSKRKQNKKTIIGIIIGVLSIIGGFFVFKKRPPSDSGGSGTGFDNPDINSPDTETAEPAALPPAVTKPHWEEYNELKAEVLKYDKVSDALPEGNERNEAIKKLNEASRAVSAYEDRAKTENFSLLEKKDLSEVSEEDRWKYFSEYAFRLMKNNEATTLDGIEMFERYGMRMQLDGEHDLWHTTLERFMVSIPDRPSDKVTGRLLEVAYKYAEPNTKEDSYEVLTLRHLLSDLWTCRVVENIGEESFLKAVKLAEKMECWNTPYKDIVEDMEWRYINRKFAKSPRLPELKEAVENLKRHIK